MSWKTVKARCCAHAMKFARVTKTEVWIEETAMDGSQR
jgi:hypothetical protein